MKIEGDLLNKLCRRAGLSLSPEERETMPDDLKKALSHFEKIRGIETEGLSPLVNPLNPPLRLREDQPEDFPEPEKEQLLEQAPEREGRLFKVPSAGRGS